MAPPQQPPLGPPPPPPPHPEPAPDNQPPSDSPPPAQNWFDKLAQRSAGITPPAPPQPETSTPERDKSLWSYAGLGLEFAGATAIFALIGLYIDRHWNTSPWGVIVLSCLGFIGGMYLLIKGALQGETDGGKPSKNSRQG
jgi:F0F1-type ATP synthase assembly protein I